MENKIGLIPKRADLSEIGIKNLKKEYWNLTPAKLVCHAIKNKEGSLTDTGALAINTGKFTGRSPKDKYVVKDENTKDTIWWGEVNNPYSEKNFEQLFNRVLAYLCNKSVYIKNAALCADNDYRLNVRVISEKASTNLFVSNMFLRLTTEEIKDFTVDWNVICVPNFKADKKIDKTRSENFAIINFTKKIILIGGTGYTGEVKKGMFSVLNYVLPYERDVLTMHCSANIDKEHNTAIFFGLSGTGKTTLSTDPKRSLIGDDEHGWAKKSIFNFEGGCYAKTINLSKDNEPDIYKAIKFGALLENVAFKKNGTSPNYNDDSITKNTRVSYPIEHIENIVKPSIGSIPKDIFFLTCDAYGILPPIAKLNKAQAMYHFLSGYTAKVAGTEEGVKEPTPSFSACFGQPFLPLHPTFYADMLGKKIESNKVRIWLINTGWIGGEYGTGKRISIKYTRKLLNSALEGKLDNVSYDKHPIFGIEFPTDCQGVPSNILNPVKSWKDQDEYMSKAKHLAKKFDDNFKKFAASCPKEVLEASPKV